jgi:hypothetical protein
MLTSGQEPPSRYTVTVTVGRGGSQLPAPVTLQLAVGQAASRTSASIVSAHTAGKIISIDTVCAPDRYAAIIVGPAVVSGALKDQALSLLIHAGLGWCGAPEVEKCS